LFLVRRRNSVSRDQEKETVIRRLRPSPAVAIALLALFVSLGGTTYAVTALPRNSVGNEQLRDRAVTEDELSNRAVISRKLATGAVVPRTIARASITGSRIAPNALGGGQIDEDSLGTVPRSQDADRAKLAERALTVDRVGRVDLADRATRADTAELADRATQAESAGLADRAKVADALGTVSYEEQETEIAEFELIGDAVLCAPGKVAVGGGFMQTSDFGDWTFIADSAPTDDGAGWAMIVFDDGPNTGQPIPGILYAVCVRAEPS
jgi:hypothetical protein